MNETTPRNPLPEAVRTATYDQAEATRFPLQRIYTKRDAAKDFQRAMRTIQEWVRQGRLAGRDSRAAAVSFRKTWNCS